MKNYICILFLLVFWFVLISNDSQAQWVSVPNFPDSLSVSSLEISGTNIFAGVYGGGILLSTDNGEKWTMISSVFGGDAVYCFALMENDSSPNIFAAGENAEVYISSNNGVNWSKTNWSGYPYSPIYSLVVSDSNLFGSNEGGEILRSINNGATWTSANSGLPSNSYTYALTAMGSKLFAGTLEHGVYFSINNGSNWSKVGSDLPFNSTVFTFATSGSNIFAGTLGDGVYISTDSGTSWSAVNNGLPGTAGRISDRRYIRTLETYGSNIFAGTDKGVFLSNNNGAHWVNTEYNFIDENGYTTVSFLAASDKYLFAGGGGAKGLFMRPFSELLGLITNVESSSSTLPSEFHLEQNYPNPFNPGTKISWQSPIAGYQTVKVYDVLGNEITILIDEYRPAGRYEAEFNAANLSSGTYFYQLKVGNFIETKKMILVK